MLEIRGLEKRFGGLAVISGLDWRIAEGELHCILGPNGAGKTTLFNLITGRLRPDRGRILFRGRDITGAKLHEIVRLGIVRKFQAPSVFEMMSVWDNLIVAGTGLRPAAALFVGQPTPDVRNRVEETIATIRLAAHRRRPAGDLSHGQKQWLEIGMVMMNAPQLVLLDEPTAGMTLAETAETADLIRHAFHGRTVVVIEHDISFVRRLDSPVTVLHRGAVMRQGSFAEIAADEAVRRVYLGEEI